MSGNRICQDGSKIRELRELRGWAQRDLAKKARCAQRTIENAEHGRRILPRILREIANALGVLMQDLLLPIAFAPSRGDGRETVEDLHQAPAGDEDAVDEEAAAAGSQAGPAIRPSSAVDAGQVAAQPSKRTLLIVDDNGYVFHGIAGTLKNDFTIYTATSADEAEQVFNRHTIDIILTDQKMQGRDGVQLLEWVGGHSPRTIRLLMTGYSEYEDLVAAINRGKLYYLLRKPWKPEELALTLRNAAEKFDLERRQEQLILELCDLNHELEERVAKRTAELQEANAQLHLHSCEMERLALTDPLTGLNNRRYMEGLGRAEAKRHGRYDKPFAIGLFDVDHFKQVNTNYLYAGGDTTLVGLAQILSSSLRETDSVGRMGGEEFLVIARETDDKGAAILAERIRATVEPTAIRHEGKAIRITISGGFAVAPAGVSATYEHLYEQACIALQEAKDGGRNRCVIRSIAGATAGVANATAKPSAV